MNDHDEPAPPPVPIGVGPAEGRPPEGAQHQPPGHASGTLAEAWRASEERYRALVDATSSAVYRMSPDWSQMRRLDGRGFLPDTSSPRSDWLSAYIHPDDQARVLGAIRAAVADGTVFDLEHRVRRADGTPGWAHSRAVPIRGADGEVVEWFGAASDATARKQAEETLRASEERLRGVAANLPNGAAFVIDPDLRYLLAGGEALGPAGFTPADLEGKTLTEVIPPDQVGAYIGNYRRALAGETFRVEHAAHGRHFVTHGGPLPDASGRVAAALAVSYDITDRKRAEEALRHSEEKYRTLFESIDEGLCLIEILEEGGRPVDYRFLEVNPAFERQTGIPAAVGRTIRQVAPGNEAHWFEIYGRVAETGEPVRFQQEAAALGRHFDVYAFRIGPADRRRVAILFTDITARKRVEAALRASEERLRLALTAARMGTWTWDVAIDAHHRDANLNALLGLPAEDTVRPLDDLLDRVHPDDRAMVRAAFDQSVRRGQPLNVEFRVAWPDGSAHWLRDQGDVSGPAGRSRMMGACIDVTDLKQAEAAIRDSRDRLEVRVAERTAALEAEMVRRRDLARRLATAQEDERRRVSRELHDSVGQLLAGLALALQAAQAAPGPGSAKLGEARGLVDALAAEVHDLAIRLRPTTLDDFGLEASLAQLVAEWSRRTGVRADFDATGLGPGRLAPEIETTIYRVVQEALTNVARHAGASLASVVVVRPDGQVSAVVEDDGIGFDPGSAPPGRLGLVGIRERVALVGGELAIESGPDSGTTLIVRIPVPEAG